MPTTREIRHLNKLKAKPTEYLGGGAFGRVYGHTSSKRCIKVADYEHESEIKALNRVKGLKLKNVVNIHDVYVTRDGHVIYIIMERLKQLTPVEERWYGDFRWKAHIYTSIDFLNKDAKEYVKTLTTEAEKKFCKGIINGAKELAKNGIDHNDTHAGNMMKDAKGNPKFVDLGLVNLTRRSRKDKTRKAKMIR